jgi:asparagine synthase (glutamine-hydrolysing)
MCGIIGVVNLNELKPISRDVLFNMLGAISHRGPDGSGTYRDRWIGMGNARLSIIDISGGDQPISNEDGSLWIVFNGEIFNYVELRAELEPRGHIFSTNSDTEVILHLFEDLGPACLERLNGQFAFAIWNRHDNSLFLARDRVGVRPVFYMQHQGQLLFASEIKAFLSVPGVNLSLDPQALTEVFTFWAPQAPRTAFLGVNELAPGHFMTVKAGKPLIQRFWEARIRPATAPKSAAEYLEEFESLLSDAVRIRLRADVPVGAYLSGGLDSSVTTALVRRIHQNRLNTFSITFADTHFDESPFQQRMVQDLGTDHHTVHCTDQRIGEIFPAVVRHAETPMLRTAPAPMYLLSELVRQQGFKVVLTGEGADEFMAGYDIFKEMKIRRFWAADPASSLRPNLLFSLYPDINRLSSSGSFLLGFFKRDLADTQSPFYSHQIRWSNTARARRFLEEDGSQSSFPPNLILPPDFSAWSPLAQAQYLEINTFLSPYLLSSQGDRMAMAHSVEGRYPFLDVRVMEFCNQLPDEYKMPGLSEKWLLRQIGRKIVPDAIWTRRKRPYRAPIHRCFYSPQPLDYVADLLSADALNRSECFNSDAAMRLSRKAATGVQLSEFEDMALVGIISTQLIYHDYVRGAARRQSAPVFSHLKEIDLTENSFIP